jgi:hypothetical protein
MGSRGWPVRAHDDDDGRCARIGFPPARTWSGILESELRIANFAQITVTSTPDHALELRLPILMAPSNDSAHMTLSFTLQTGDVEQPVAASLFITSGGELLRRPAASTRT